jgi:hypothetical protein
VCVLEIKQGEGLRTNPGKKSTKNSDMAHFQYCPQKKKKKKKKKKNPNHMQRTNFTCHLGTVRVLIP